MDDRPHTSQSERRGFDDVQNHSVVGLVVEVEKEEIWVSKHVRKSANLDLVFFILVQLNDIAGRTNWKFKTSASHRSFEGFFVAQTSSESLERFDGGAQNSDFPFQFGRIWMIVSAGHGFDFGDKEYVLERSGTVVFRSIASQAF